MISAVAVCLIISVIVAWYLLVPHFQSESATALPESAADRSLRDQKERCLQVLKDLELDFQTGKVAADDYQQTRTTLTNELGAILEKLERGAAQ